MQYDDTEFYFYIRVTLDLKAAHTISGFILPAIHHLLCNLSEYQILHEAAG